MNIRRYVDQGVLFPFDPTAAVMWFSGYELAAAELHIWGIGPGEMERPAPSGTMCLAALAERWELPQQHVRSIVVDGWLERTDLGFITIDSIFDVEEMGMVEKWQRRVRCGDATTPYLVQTAELEIDWPAVAGRLGVAVDDLKARHRHGLDLSDHYHDGEAVQSLDMEGDGV